MPVNVNKSSPAAAFKWLAVFAGTIATAVAVSFLYAFIYHNLEALWH